MREPERMKFEIIGAFGIKIVRGWQFDPHLAIRLFEDSEWYGISHLNSGMLFPVDMKNLEDADWVSEEISKLTDWGAIKSKEDFDALPAYTIARIKKEVETIDQTLEMQYSGRV